MFIISGQTHNQKKNNEKLTVRWGSTLSISHKAIKYLCLFITPLREPVENYSTDFFRYGGTPPPYPLNTKSFCQKTLGGKGGYTPPLNGKLPKIVLKKWVKKG